MIDLKKDVIPYINHIEELITSEFWNNLLMDCTKNELLVLWLLYQKEEVNMTQVAESIHAPLNTATGIVSRMEKRHLVSRQRSDADKRVVTITFDIDGKKQIEAIITKLTYYITRVMSVFGPEEIQLLEKMMAQLLTVMKEEKQKDVEKPHVRKIEIT